MCRLYENQLLQGNIVLNNLKIKIWYKIPWNLQYHSDKKMIHIKWVDDKPETSFDNKKKHEETKILFIVRFFFII